MPRIGILVVAYNAESTLEKVLQRIPVDVYSKIEEVFVFDDASSDRTYETGRSLMQEPWAHKLKIFRNPVNLMYGGNQRKGYQYAIGRGLDIVVLLHGDGQYAAGGDAGVADAAGEWHRRHGNGITHDDPRRRCRGNMPMYKYVGNKILTCLENTLAGLKLTEFHSGYRAYSVAA